MSRFIISNHIYIIYTYGSNKNIFGKNLTIYNNIIYCLYVSNYIVCYAIYKIENDDGVIDLNYSANYRKIFMQKLENKFKKDKYNKILWNLSVDPTKNIHYYL